MKIVKYEKLMKLLIDDFENLMVLAENNLKTKMSICVFLVTQHTGVVGSRSGGQTKHAFEIQHITGATQLPWPEWTKPDRFSWHDVDAQRKQRLGEHKPELFYAQVERQSSGEREELQCSNERRRGRLPRPGRRRRRDDQRNRARKVSAQSVRRSSRRRIESKVQRKT